MNVFCIIKTPALFLFKKSHLIKRIIFQPGIIFHFYPWRNYSQIIFEFIYLIFYRINESSDWRRALLIEKAICLVLIRSTPSLGLPGLKLVHVQWRSKTLIQSLYSVTCVTNTWTDIQNYGRVNYASLIIRERVWSDPLK